MIWEEYHNTQNNMDRSYVRMLAVSGYQSLKLDDVHNAMTSPVFQRVIITYIQIHITQSPALLYKS